MEEKSSEFIVNEPSSASSLVFEWSELISQSIIVVVFLMAFFYRSYNIDGTSMLQTLTNKDKVVVCRYDYKPQNGDVVVIRRFKEMSKRIKGPIIKRLIAKENQVLEINFKTGRVAVNEKEIQETYAYLSGINSKGLKFDNGDIGMENYKLTIPKGYSFVMGDNRDGSTDSRFNEIGLIKNEDIVGKAVYRYFPFYKAGKIT
jgi:signal peptidase I